MNSGVVKSKTIPLEKIIGFIFGVVLIIVLLVLAFVFDDLNNFQYVILKTVLALTAAGVGGVLTGFIQIKSKWKYTTIRAGGAFALFIIVFFFTPEQSHVGYTLEQFETQLNSEIARLKAEQKKDIKIKSQENEILSLKLEKLTSKLSDIDNSFNEEVEFLDKLDKSIKKIPFVDRSENKKSQSETLAAFQLGNTDLAKSLYKRIVTQKTRY